MARRLLLLVSMVWLAVAVIVSTTTDDITTDDTTTNDTTTTTTTTTDSPHMRLIDAIKIPTISNDDGSMDAEKFEKFLALIVFRFPYIHIISQKITFEVVNEYSLLYHINGTNSTLQPYLLAAHYDVVPADAKKWTYPPFDGAIGDKVLYGRGTLDDKSILLAILETLNTKLIIEKSRPRRGFYVAFGHDEEVNGLNGARHIARLLEDRGVKLKFILDEGTPILDIVTSLVWKPLAIVAVAEKGFATFQMTAKGTSGHSSIPSRNTTIDRLARAISRLENNPHPIKLDSPFEKIMVKNIAPQFSYSFDVIVDHKDLFIPSFELVAARNPIINAMLRTTTAFTVIEGGFKNNVIPDSAKVIINHRIYPTDTVQSVYQYDKTVVDDENISIQIMNQSEPSTASPHDDTAFGYEVINRTIHSVYPRAIVTPGLSVASTDTKWYRNLTDQIYRFSPYVVTLADVATIHGVNEKISTKNIVDLEDFYYKLIDNADLADRVNASKTNMKSVT